jgi:ATP-dependent exoDNAse (exonuclease V) beta subunit
VVLRDEAGRPVQAELLDFKTDRCEAEEIPALVEIYRPQMLAYREALSALLGLYGEALRTRLLFVTPGYTVDLV